jgi:filamin
MLKRKNIFGAGTKKFKPSKSELEEFRKTLEDVVEEDNAKDIVEVGPFKKSHIKAYGSGLEGGVVGYPANFIVETNWETDRLGFFIEGPSQARIDCADNLDGSVNVTYWPTVVGEYAVHVLCDNEDIPRSPYMAWIEQKGNFDPTNV